MQATRFFFFWAFALVIILVAPSNSNAQNTKPIEPPKGVPSAFSSPMTAESADVLRAKAESGDAESQYELAYRLYHGTGITKDPVESVKWYKSAAEQGNLEAQFELGCLYGNYHSVPGNEAIAFNWFRAAAERGLAKAQRNLGVMFLAGRGTTKNYAEAFKWCQAAAAQGDVTAQLLVGSFHQFGQGTTINDAEAAAWYLKASEQGFSEAQWRLGRMFVAGRGVPKNHATAYKWWILAAAQGHEEARGGLAILERELTPAQQAEGQQMAKDFQPRKAPRSDELISRSDISQSRPESTGSGFFITDDGYLITNEHVASEGASVRVLTGNGAIPAKVVKVDRANDIALLKAEGRFSPLAITSSRGVRLGSTAATVGFPNVGLQGYSPKLAKGEIASLAGVQDDARHFQVSVPVQPGNSGGALVDERGNVIGVVVAKLSQKAAIATTGTLAENVSYAVKSSYLLSFLESVPDVAAKLKEPNTNDRKFEDVIKDAEQAAVLVLVY